MDRQGAGRGGASAHQLRSYITYWSPDLLKAKIMSSYLLAGLSPNPEGAWHPEAAHTISWTDKRWEVS